jgi:hypothetical protein
MRRLAFCLALFLLAADVRAQTAPTAVFTASPDHNAVVGGVAIVASYQLDMMHASATGALAFSKGLGKPTPDASNTISVAIPEFLAQPSGVYVGTVSAVGPGGAGKSAPSDPFAWVTAPAQPGKPSIR